MRILVFINSQFSHSYFPALIKSELLCVRYLSEPLISNTARRLHTRDHCLR